MTSQLPADDLSRSLTVSSVDAADVRSVAVAGGAYTVLLTGAQTGGRYSLIDMLVPPGGGPPLHRHDFEEMFAVLDGEIELTFRGETHRAGKGSVVNIPANAPHKFRNTSDRPAHLLCLCAPPGQEDFFLAVGDPLDSRDSPPPTLSDAEKGERRDRAQALAAQYRTELLGP
ncbi:MAG: cupin domain-containing protein [Vicinamibacteraceae bacterium]